jgi:uncharacterized membrane protein YphA (DoxX/SURF4 family)
MTEASEVDKFEGRIKELLQLANHPANGHHSPDVEQESAPPDNAGAYGSPDVKATATELRLDSLAEQHAGATAPLGAGSDVHLDAPRAADRPASVGPSKRAPGSSRLLFAFGRSVIVIPFVVSAILTLFDANALAQIISAKLEPFAGTPILQGVTWFEATLGLPFAKTLVLAGATLEVVASVLIAIGVLLRPASVVLLIFAGIAIYCLPWSSQSMPDVIMRALEELSIAGALLVLCTYPTARS